MIIFLYGPDTYRSRLKLEEIVEKYRKIHKSGLNLRIIEGQEDDFQVLKDSLRQISMLFKEKKFFILKDIFSNSVFREKFLKDAKGFVDSDNIVLFYEKQNIKTSDSLFKFLKSKAKCQEFPLLEGQKLKNWAKKEFEKHQSAIEPEALEILVDYIGNDLWQFSNEIKKLTSFKRGKKITREDVELLVKPKQIETDIFKTIDAIATKNKRTALSLLHKHLQKGDSPLYLLSMITFQFRNLLVVKNLIENRRPYYAFAKITKLHPFVVRKSYSQAQKFTFEELKKIYQKIFQIDFQIKTGKIASEAALDLLIAEV